MKVKVGEEEYLVKYLRPASKGDTIFGVWGQWLIAVNLPWGIANEYLANSNVEYTVYAEKIKENPERKYTLVRVNRVERTYERTREEVKHKEPEIYEFHGIRVKTGATTVTEIKEKVTEVWTPESGEFREIKVQRSGEWSYTDERTTYEILEENEITKLIRKSKEFYLNDVLNGFGLSEYYGTKFKKFDGIDEQILLDLSRYYVIVYPFLTCRFNHVYYHIIYVYYNGRKLEIPLNTFDSELPPPLDFRISLRRLALTKHYKSLLPYGGYFGNPEKFVEFARKAYLAVQGTRTINEPIFDVFRTKPAKIKVKELTQTERFLEIFFLRTPKRKFEAVEQHLRLYEKVREMLRDEPVLYIAFPNKYGSRSSNYACFRIQGDSITVTGVAQVPVTAITIKGKFEEAYKIVHGLKKLLRYQFASKEKKVQMIREDVEALRREIEEKFGNVAELHPERDIMKYLFDRAENYDGDNLVLILYKAKKLERAPENVTLLKLAGLIKSGKDYDYTVDRLKDVLESLRIAVKYEIKSKGYSPKLGVVFSGTAYNIAKAIFETVKKVKEARLKALLAEILTGESLKEIKVEVSLERMDALMKELL
ncbi:hypothetical protein DRP04_07275 [Archaeoglobales archaeon]|nr:MAG: hypothetical protein DRP04_07275 [Archaeoglobales archaeon]